LTPDEPPADVPAEEPRAFGPPPASPFVAPGSVAPGYGRPEYGTAGYGPPGYGPPGYGPPAGYGPPGYGPPGYGPPGYGPPGHGGAPYGPFGGYGPYGGYGGYGFAPARKTNVLAILSLCAGLVSFVVCWLGIFTGIAALVLGLVARRQIRDRDEQGGGMAIAGAITGGLAALLYVAFLTLTIVASVTSPGYGPGYGGGPRSPITTTTIRERTAGTTASSPGAPRTTKSPSGAIRIEACPRVVSAYSSFVRPEVADAGILNDAARTLHAELPPGNEDDIDLILVDARPRIGQDTTGARSSAVQAALDRVGRVVDDGCPS